MKRSIALTTLALALLSCGGNSKPAPDNAGSAAPEAQIATADAFCRSAVDDHYASADLVPAGLVSACDHRSATLAGPCQEDEICALAEIRSTGDFSSSVGLSTASTARL